MCPVYLLVLYLITCRSVLPSFVIFNLLRLFYFIHPPYPFHPSQNPQLQCLRLFLSLSSYSMSLTHINHFTSLCQVQVQSVTELSFAMAEVPLISAHCLRLSHHVSYVSIPMLLPLDISTLHFYSSSFILMTFVIPKFMFILYSSIPTSIFCNIPCMIDVSSVRTSYHQQIVNN